MAHIDLAEGTGEPRPPLRDGSGSLNIPHTARLPRQFFEQSSPRSTTMKPHGTPLVAGVGCQSTHLDPCTSSPQTMCRALQPKNRQVSLVYRCWNFAVKVSLSPTLGDPRRAFQAAILTRHVVAASGDRARGSPAGAAQEPRGTGRPKSPTALSAGLQQDLKGSHFSVVPCLSPISATVTFTRYDRVTRL